MEGEAFVSLGNHDPPPAGLAALTGETRGGLNGERWREKGKDRERGRK